MHALASVIQPACCAPYASHTHAGVQGCDARSAGLSVAASLLLLACSVMVCSAARSCSAAGCGELSSGVVWCGVAR